MFEDFAGKENNKGLNMKKYMDETMLQFGKETKYGIREINRMAHEKGITYGQMVAAGYAKNVRIIKPKKV